LVADAVTPIEKFVYSLKKCFIISKYNHLIKSVIIIQYLMMYIYMFGVTDAFTGQANGKI